MAIGLNSIEKVNNQLTLHSYYLRADELYRKASTYRKEKNVVDLYIMLVRYSSLVSETIPLHRDYKLVCEEECKIHKNRLPALLDELESLKPEFQRLKNVHSGAPAGMTSQSSWKNNNDYSQVISPNSMDIVTQLQKLCPKKETLSRHSFFGPNGLQGQQIKTRAEGKVHYPSSEDLTPTENLFLKQAGQGDIVAAKECDAGGVGPTMESVYSLDDGLQIESMIQAVMSSTPTSSEVSTSRTIACSNDDPYAQAMRIPKYSGRVHGVGTEILPTRSTSRSSATPASQDEVSILRTRLAIQEAAQQAMVEENNAHVAALDARIVELETRLTIKQKLVESLMASLEAMSCQPAANDYTS